MPAQHEGRCCDAVLRVIESQLQAERTGLRFPDKIDRSNKRVDVCVGVGMTRYVLEHTRIEPFSEAIAAGAFLQKLVSGVKKRLVAHAPLPGPGYYDLRQPQDQRLGGGVRSRARRRDKIEQQIADWVSSEAAPLFARASNLDLHRPTSIKREFSGSFTVHLICTPTGPPCNKTQGEFGAVRDTSESTEEQLVTRLRKAAADKCPKLLSCKRRGARTVLVLENSDILLGHISVRKALKQASDKRDDLPDEIYLVDTKAEGDWYVFPMNAGADSLFGSGPFPDGLNHHRVFRLGDLMDLKCGVADHGCEFCADN